MKKLIALMLVLGLMMTMLAACVSTTTSDDGKKLSNSSTESSKEQGGEEDPQTPEEVTLAETVIYDENDIKITVTGLDEGWAGPEVKVLVENNSNQNIAFSTDEFVINGVTMPGFGYVEAAAGKKTNDSIMLYSSYLEMAGIDTLATIVSKDAHIFDTDSYESLYETPFSLTTSAGADYVQTVDDSGDVLFQSDGVTVIAKTVEEDLTGKSVYMLVKNETGKDIVVNAENISVNGYTVTGLMYDTVYADTVSFCSIALLSSELETNEIETVEEVCFTLEIMDAESYDTIAQSEELSLTVAE